MSRYFQSNPSPTGNIVLGLLEFSSIAVGIKTLDAMIKMSPIQVIDARTITPGHYLTLFTGEVAEVEESVNKGLEEGRDLIIDHLLISNLHEQIIPALYEVKKVNEYHTLGIVETKTVVSAIVSVDQALKATDITLLELRLASGLGGKSFYIVMGELFDVQESIDRAVKSIEIKNALLHYEIIPSPHEDLKDFF